MGNVFFSFKFHPYYNTPIMTPPKTKSQILKNGGLGKVTPALNMAIFDNYFRFLGCKVEW